MARPRKYVLDDLAVALDYGLPRSREEGWTIDEVAGFLEVPLDVARKVTHHHRNVLSDDTAAMLVRTDNGREWRYWLSTDPDEIKEYGKRRTDDAETRLKTIHRIAARSVKLTDGRSTQGRRARMMEVHLRHLVEQLELFAESTA